MKAALVIAIHLKLIRQKYKEEEWKIWKKIKFNKLFKIIKNLKIKPKK